ncbi:MAG: hypothetical protein GXP55_11055 [Deltaproteobacteria bacterium]|nr:hypothetical protein [Deltaproteobacteria bacterium]
MTPQRKAAARISGRRLCVWAAALALAQLTGCAGRPAGAVDTCTFSGAVAEHKLWALGGLDLLLVIDNSPSMAGERAALAAQLPHILEVLSTGQLLDPELEELRLFPAPVSLHLGVIDTDMGAGGFASPGCAEPNFGDDGILRDSSALGCGVSVPAFLNFPNADDPATMLTAATCLTSAGSSSCGFPQPLDAALKALTPSISSTTFAMGTRGHGNNHNAGFLRSATALAILLLTDGDDCSASDRDLNNPSSPRYVGDLSLRCFRYPEALYPPSRYVRGLLDLRSGSPELLVFGALVGMPGDLVPDIDEPDFAAVLDDPRMQQAPDPSAPSGLAASCDVPGVGPATPPRRIVQVAQALHEAGANVALGSICQGDYRTPIDAFLTRLADVFGQNCLPRIPTRRPSGKVECMLVEVLPAEGELTRCSQLADAGRSRLRTHVDSEGVAHELCEVRQLLTTTTTTEVPTGMGWYYDDFSARTDRLCGDHQRANGTQGQRIAYTRGAEPRPGVMTRFECVRRASGSSGGPGTVGPGTPCGMDRRDVCADSDVPDLVCADNSHTCVVRCSEDYECRDHGLAGQRCVDDMGGACAASGAPEGACFCTNPVCEGT